MATVAYKCPNCASPLTYDGNTGKFTPVEGFEANEDYIKRIKATISNKQKFSKAVSYYNYFNYITPELEKMNSGA